MIKNIFFAIISVLSLNSQEKEPVSWTYEVNKVSNLDYEITFEAVIIDGWKLYSQFSPEEGSIATSFKFLNNFGKYGDFTYGIYIYHFPIIQLFVFLGFFNTYSIAISCLVVLMVTLLLAILSWYLVEIPYLSESRRSRQKKLRT